MTSTVRVMPAIRSHPHELRNHRNESSELIKDEETHQFPAFVRDFNKPVPINLLLKSTYQICLKYSTEKSTSPRLRGLLTYLASTMKQIAPTETPNLDLVEANADKWKPNVGKAICAALLRDPEVLAKKDLQNHLALLHNHCSMRLPSPELLHPEDRHRFFTAPALPLPKLPPRTSHPNASQLNSKRREACIPRERRRINLHSGKLSYPVPAKKVTLPFIGKTQIVVPIPEYQTLKDMQKKSALPIFESVERLPTWFTQEAVASPVWNDSIKSINRLKGGPSDLLPQFTPSDSFDSSDSSSLPSPLIPGIGSNQSVSTQTISGRSRNTADILKTSASQLSKSFEPPDPTVALVKAIEEKYDGAVPPGLQVYLKDNQKVAYQDLVNAISARKISSKSGHWNQSQDRRVPSQMPGEKQYLDMTSGKTQASFQAIEAKATPEEEKARPEKAKPSISYFREHLSEQSNQAKIRAFPDSKHMRNTLRNTNIRKQKRSPNFAPSFLSPELKHRRLGSSPEESFEDHGNPIVSPFANRDENLDYSRNRNAAILCETPGFAGRYGLHGGTRSLEIRRPTASSVPQHSNSLPIANVHSSPKLTNISAEPPNERVLDKYRAVPRRVSFNKTTNVRQTHDNADDGKQSKRDVIMTEEEQLRVKAEAALRDLKERETKLHEVLLSKLTQALHGQKLSLKADLENDEDAIKERAIEQVGLIAEQERVMSQKLRGPIKQVCTPDLTKPNLLEDEDAIRDHALAKVQEVLDSESSRPKLPPLLSEDAISRDISELHNGRSAVTSKETDRAQGAHWDSNADNSLTATTKSPEADGFDKADGQEIKKLVATGTMSVPDLQNDADAIRTCALDAVAQAQSEEHRMTQLLKKPIQDLIDTGVDLTTPDLENDPDAIRERAMEAVGRVQIHEAKVTAALKKPIADLVRRAGPTLTKQSEKTAHDEERLAEVKLQHRTRVHTMPARSNDMRPENLSEGRERFSGGTRLPEGKNRERSSDNTQIPERKVQGTRQAEISAIQPQSDGDAERSYTMPLFVSRVLRGGTLFNF